jgi:acetate kinase
MKRRLSTYWQAGLTEKGRVTGVLLEVSARHVHLSARHLGALFGMGAVLHSEHELSQPGQYALVEKVNVVGPKGRIDGMRVLGPVRTQTQVGVSMTDTFKLGQKAPIRESGVCGGSPGITVEGPAGMVRLAEGLICAMRHIHMSEEDAGLFGLRDKDVVRVRVPGDRELAFRDTLVRARSDFRLAMHIDTHEANAADLATGMTVFIGSIQGRGRSAPN